MENSFKQKALDFHSELPNGKIGTLLTKTMKNADDMSLAYSPGVSFPCLEIDKDEFLSYKYTSKANTVAIITNSTAVLGLGKLKPIAGKPVMEGKCALFKRFANVDGVDIEINTTNVDEFVKTVELIGETWGGINLEDISAPSCFEIEKQLKSKLNIPVFHDDQHGTAIIALAGLMNSLEIANKDVKKIKVLVNGVGAAGVAFINLIKLYGVPAENIIACDSKGIINSKRTDISGYKLELVNTKYNHNSLDEAFENLDVAVGLSVQGAFKQDYIKKMAKNPLIFAMANPNPEITPAQVHEVRDDAIVGTGRSDYANQINNVACFPFLFRGALDCISIDITDSMKIRVAKAIATLAKENVPQIVQNAYPDRKLSFGKNYILPTIFDYRLMSAIAPEVVLQAQSEGIARKPINDIEEYRKNLEILSKKINGIE